MSDLLIPDLDPGLRRALERLARVHERAVAEEARAILENSVASAEAEPGAGERPPPGMGLGTWMFSLVPPEFRVDLDYDYPDVPSDPPDFA